jgi:predicted outer membrane repeat protein
MVLRVRPDLALAREGGGGEFHGIAVWIGAGARSRREHVCPARSAFGSDEGVGLGGGEPPLDGRNSLCVCHGPQYSGVRGKVLIGRKIKDTEEFACLWFDSDAGGRGDWRFTSMLMAATPAGAVGTTYTVDTLADGAANASDCTTPVAGSCSLRDALDADATNDTIVFAPGLSGTITLTSGELEINRAIVLTGPGKDLLTIDAAGGSRVFYVAASSPVTIEGLTITGGSSSNGAGLYDEGGNGFTLRDVLVTGNVASGSGGGLHGGGDVTLINTLVLNNTGTSGGGIFMKGNLVMEGSTISGNTAATVGGGGAYVGGDISITTSTFDDNTADSCGGGLYARVSNGMVTITDSTFSNNTADSCYGGAIDIDGNGNTVVIANTTITGNSAPTGGGLQVDNDNDVSLFMDTITGNSATSTDALYSGGGIHLSGELQSPATLTIVGSIVSGNTAVAGPADIGVGNANDFGPNPVSINDSLIGDVDSRLTVTGAGNVTSTTPGLDALADNGGLTMTMALLSTSAAVDAGPSVVPTFTGNGFDQRGTGFARVVGTRADIGAFETQAPEPTTTTAAPTTTAASGEIVPTFTG